MLNLQQLVGDLERLFGKTQQAWGRLLDKPFAVMQGRRHELVGKFKAMQALAENKSIHI